MVGRCGKGMALGMLPLCLYLDYLGMLGTLGMLHVGAMLELLRRCFSLPYLHVGAMVEFAVSSAYP
jgi:hypothetical protein